MKTNAKTTATITTLPVAPISFADVLHKAQSHKGRVEALHRAGSIKRSTVNGLHVADEGKRTQEDKAAYKCVEHFAFLASLAGITPAEYAEMMDDAMAYRAEAAVAKAEALAKLGLNTGSSQSLIQPLVRPCWRAWGLE